MARPNAMLLRRDQSRPAQSARPIRRMVIQGVTDDGVELGGPGEDGDGNVERFGLEVFGVAGFVSRPTGNAEAVIATVGGQRGHQVVIAVRDPAAARAAGVDNLPGGEVAVYAGGTALKIDANGDVWIARKGKELERVATESHVHTAGLYVTGAGAVTGVSGPAAPNPGTAPTHDPAKTGWGLSPVLRAQGKP